MSVGSGPLGPRTRPTRRGVLALGAAAAAVAGSGCVPSGARPAPATRTLKVAAFPLVDQIVQAAEPAWRQRHPDVALEVVSRPYADHHTAMTTALSTAVSLPAVMALESSYVGRYQQGEGLEDLGRPPYDAGRFRDRFVRYAFDQTINRRGEIVALPTDIGPGTLLYRADLLAKAGLQAADLQSSWEAYIDAGHRLRAATGARLLGAATMVKDIVIRSGLQPGEGLYFDHDSRVLVESPRFVRAFTLARRVRESGLDARAGDWTNDWAEGLRRGTIATLLSGEWMVGQLANWVAPGTKGLWRACEPPEHTAVAYGGTFYAIPRHASPEDKRLGWDLIQMLTLDRARQLDALRSQDAFPALLEAQDDPFFEEPIPFLGGQRARVLWRETARRITATQVHKQNNFAEEVVNTELSNVLDRGKPIPLALADARRLLERRANR